MFIRLAILVVTEIKRLTIRAKFTLTNRLTHSLAPVLKL